MGVENYRQEIMYGKSLHNYGNYVDWWVSEENKHSKENRHQKTTRNTKNTIDI